MNIDYSLEQFIKSKTPQSLILKGSWGIGKTYYWNDFLVKNYAKVFRENYCYISLFGIKNLESLKFSVFENTISKENITEATKTRSFNWKQLVRNIPQEIDIPLSRINIPLEKIISNNISNTLICFDDLERMNSKLSFNEFLGFVNYLKEEKNCSIIIIINQDQIQSKSDLEDYTKYKEKTIDREIVLDRSTDEVLKIIFNEDKYFDIISDSIRILDIKNLRILQRVSRLIDELFQLVPKNFELDTYHELIKTIILFTWIKFNSEEKVPSIYFLKRYIQGFIGTTLSKDENVEKEFEEKWNPIIQKYGFSVYTDYDEIIWNYIDHGILNTSTFITEIQSRNQKFHTHNNYKLINSAWDLYGDNFFDNLEEFTQGLTDAIITNIKGESINLSQINSAYEILKELGKDEFAKSILNEYEPVVKKQTLPQLKESYRYMRSKLHQDLELLIETKAKKVKIESSFEEILDTVVYKNSWGGDVIEFLKDKTEDEYFDFLTLSDSKDVHGYIDFCLKLGESSNSSEDHLEIANKIKKALKKISETNKLNKVRIESIYGSRID